MATTLKQRAYEYIRRQLLSGELSPGSRLCNRTLAEQIGMSFIPVREAISQLASEGLIEHRPRLGAFVLDPSREQIEELYDFREALECHAATKAAGRISSDELAEMEAFNATLLEIVAQRETAGSEPWTIEQVDRWMMADAGFHMLLLRAARNRHMMKTVSDLRVMAQIFGRRWSNRSSEYLQQICAVHARLIEALRNGEAEEAASVMREHLRHGCHAAVEDHDCRRFDSISGHMPTSASSDELQERIHQIEETSGS